MFLLLPFSLSRWGRVLWQLSWLALVLGGSCPAGSCPVGVVQVADVLVVVSRVTVVQRQLTRKQLYG